MFVTTEDWFMASHFLPLIKQAKQNGWRVIVAARSSSASEKLQRWGAEVIPWAGDRSERGLGQLWRRQRMLNAIVQKEKPDLIHAISLAPSVMGGLCGGRHRTLFAVTGLGFLAAEAPRNLLRRFQLTGFAALIGLLARIRRAVVIFENGADLAMVRPFIGSTAADRCVVLPGAGVDTDHFRPLPLPQNEPFRIGVVARLIRSKGIEEAVDSIKMVRSRGLNAELLIAGAPDPGNPASHTAADLAIWSATPGIRLLGRVNDVREFWSQTHVALLASRGGEGLPRALLEAAACGRAIVTTDVPGCCDFVEDGVSGWVAPARAPAEIADRIARLAQSPSMLESMGKAARARVLAGHTEAHIAKAADHAWSIALR